LADDGSDPPHYPNAYKNPLAQIKFSVPTVALDDPERGPNSPRHKAWSQGGAQAARFEWVALDSSLQWKAFQRVVEILRQRDNDILVVLGPFNEHMVAEENQAGFRKIRDGITLWLEQRHIPRLVPEPLPSPLYADASHPLTEGYEV